MSTMSLKLVTIISEALLEDRLVRDIKRLGAKGYTRSDVRGEGRRQVRDPWEGNNVKIEALVSPEVAERILAHVSSVYAPLYAVVAWVIDVQAVVAEQHINLP